MSKDYYHILGVSKGANDTDIKKAYRKLAMQYHPDKHKGDKESEKKFKEINEAYQVLSDPQKRTQYDQFGTADFGAGGGFSGFGPGFSGAGFDFSSFAGSTFSDIFETFFGGTTTGRRKRGAIRGEDLEAAVQLTFEEAAFGCEKELHMAKMAACEHCNGKGTEPGSSIVTCRKCEGTGEIRMIRHTILGQVTTSATCDACYGEGRVPEKPCFSCHGNKRVRKSERIKVKIPAGVDQGSSIRLHEKGEAGIDGGRPGDLYIHIQVLPHKKFIRSGADIHSEQMIHMLQAVLGDEIDIETLHGLVRLRIPSGTGSGRVFRLNGHGIPYLKKSGNGDHYVKISVQIPQKLSKKEREFYEALAKEAGLKLNGQKSFLKNLGF